MTKRVIRKFLRIHRPEPPGAGGADRAATHVLQKLGLHDRVQAVVLAHQAGLFEAD